jgi:hypothetical protein
MRKVLIILFCHWPKCTIVENNFEIRFLPLYSMQQFSINPYTNDIWLMGSYDVSVIEVDGTENWDELLAERAGMSGTLVLSDCRASE